MKNVFVVMLYLFSTILSEFNAQQNEAYQLRLSQLQVLDQMYRKNGLGEEQEAIDRLNRHSLDSLYSIYGFPSENAVGAEGQYTMWAILQHSKDCEFNKKWFYRFVDQFEKGKVTVKLIDLINGSFHRFFIDDPARSRTRQAGSCYKQNVEGITLFMDKIREDFSTETLKTLGLD